MGSWPANRWTVRFNLSERAEAALVAQVGLELSAGATYRALAAWAGRWDVALGGFRAFFRKAQAEESEHADAFIEYLLSRGGRVSIPAVDAVAAEPRDILDAVQRALGLEHAVNAAILRLHSIASADADPHLSNFLESDFVTEQVTAIRFLAELATKLRTAGPGHGVLAIDAKLLAESK